MRLQELLEAQVIGQMNFGLIKPGKVLSHGLLGPVTVIRIEGNSVLVKTKQGKEVKVGPASLSIGESIDLDEESQLNEYVKKVNGKWVVGLSKADYDLIDNALKDLIKIGLPKSMNIKCDNCGEIFEAPINFNPSDFFG